jgi:hypothetical protein
VGSDDFSRGNCIGDDLHKHLSRDSKFDRLTLPQEFEELHQA